MIIGICIALSMCIIMLFFIGAISGWDSDVVFPIAIGMVIAAFSSAVGVTVGSSKATETIDVIHRVEDNQFIIKGIGTRVVDYTQWSSDSTAVRYVLVKPKTEAKDEFTNFN